MALSLLCREYQPFSPMKTIPAICLWILVLMSFVSASQRMLVDFGNSAYPTTATGWNNITSGATGTSIAGLRDINGNPTGIKLSITDGFWQQIPGLANNSGTLSSTLYPGSATRDSFFIGLNNGYLDNKAQIQLGNLVSGKKYTIRLYASRMTTDLVSDRTTIYTIDGVSKALQVRNNENGFVEFSNLTTSTGVLDVGITMKAGAVFGYLGVMDITQNSLPVAAAGADQNIKLPTNQVILAGTGQDSDGSIKAYSWSQVSGPSTAVFSSKSAAQPTVSGLVQGVYTFRLTVTDDTGATDSDDVTVTVSSQVTTLSAAKETLRPYGSVAGANYGYIEYLPEGYLEKSNWPVIIFLHGIGERTPALLSSVGKYGPINYIRNGHKLPAVILAPQEFGSSDWKADGIEKFRAFAYSRYKIDPKRFYITGLSLGGQGVNRYLNAYGEKPAAAMPIAPACTLSSIGASKIVTNHVPCWGAHANAEKVCTPFNTINSFNRISTAFAGTASLTLPSFSGTTATKRTAHYDINLKKWVYVDGQTPPTSGYQYFVTIYESTEHGIWGYIYNDANVYNWLFSKTK